MHTAIKTGGHEAYKLKYFMVDTEKDITEINIEDCSMGSSAKAIDTGRTYILNSKDEWIKQPLSSTNSGSGDQSEEIAQLKKQIQALQDEIAKLKTPVVTNETMKIVDGQVNNDTLTLSPETLEVKGDTLIIGG